MNFGRPDAPYINIRYGSKGTISKQARMAPPESTHPITRQTRKRNKGSQERLNGTFLT
jgi:hypothetical protein